MCLRCRRVSCDSQKNKPTSFVTHPDVQPLLICSWSGDDMGFSCERWTVRTFVPAPTSSPDSMRGNGVEFPTVGPSPSMTATAAPPRTKPRTDIASSSLPRAAPCMKPEMPKVLLLKERRACTGKARQTPPRKDWRGVADIVRWVYAAGGQCHFRKVGCNSDTGFLHPG